jgi:predicted transcriptional regulator
MSTQIPQSVRAGRFSAKVVIHEDPDVVVRLQELAAENAVSSSALVRLALRQLLERIDRPEPTIR